MVSKPDVSILMPVKNAALFLAECITSIRKQSFSEWELVAIDDHSDDDSWTILNQFAILDKRITIAKNNGRGIIDALRTAYHKSRGAHITRMDADDVMLPNKIASLYQALAECPDGLAIGQVQYFSHGALGNGYLKYAHWLNETTKQLKTFEAIYRECTVPSPCWMTSRKTLDQCGAFDFNYYPEDYDLAFRFKKIGPPLRPVQHILHLWRDHRDRTSRTDDKYADNRFTALKIHHFLDQDRDLEKPLVIWGASAKGKAIAKALLGQGTTFSWMTNNPKKIGHEIYQVMMEHWDCLSQQPPSQVIIAISSESNDQTVSRYLAQNTRHDFYRFS